MKKVKILIFSILLLFLLIGCSEKEIETVTLSIYVDEELYEEKVVNKGSKIDFDLNDESYLFLGWFDATGENSLDGIEVNENMNLYAKTIEKGTKYKINYHFTDTANYRGINYPRTYTVGEVTQLVNPQRPYSFEFTGWYYNGELITEIPDDWYGDIDLYDSWKDNNTYHTITYVSDGATSYSDEIITNLMDGVTYDIPYAIKEGYFFNGWYLDSEFKTRIYTIDEDNKSDITLYAKFTEKTKANTYVSFVGDSISTYHGLIPEDAGAYYPTYLDFPKEHTYFLLTCTGMGFNFLRNDSYAGSRLTSIVKTENVTLQPALSDYRIANLTDGVHDPDILIIHIGTNDYSQGIDKYTFRSCIERYVIKLRKVYDDVEIYFCLHPANGYGEDYIEKREGFNEMIVEESKETESNYGIIDLTKAWNQDNYQDYIFSNAHPNEAGFKAMADVIIEELQKTHTYE